MSIQPFSVIVASGQPVFSEGIKNILVSEQTLECIGVAGNMQELDGLLRSNATVLILEGNSAVFSKDDLKGLIESNPQCKVIVLSEHREPEFFELVHESNVYAFLNKDCSLEELKKAIFSTCHGEKYFCSSVVDYLLHRDKRSAQSSKGLNILSKREKEITRLIAEGKMNKEIASRLCLSPHTVHSHRKNIMKKLGVHSAVELINFAKDAGLLK